MVWNRKRETAENWEGDSFTNRSGRVNFKHNLSYCNFHIKLLKAIYKDMVDSFEFYILGNITSLLSRETERIDFHWQGTR